MYHRNLSSRRFNKSMESLGVFGCLLQLVCLAFYLWASSTVVNYLIFFIWEKTIPWFFALVIGLLTGPATITISIILWILRNSGII